MALTDDDVEAVARLARIAITPAERVKLRADLSAVLDYVQTLNALGVDGEEPLSHVNERFAPARTDTPRPEACLDRAIVLAQAPAADATHFLVPPVVDTRG